MPLGQRWEPDWADPTAEPGAVAPLKRPWTIEDAELAFGPSRHGQHFDLFTNLRVVQTRPGLGRARLLTALVVVLALGPMMYGLAQVRGRAQDPEPDYSFLVLSRSPADLPSPVVTRRENPTPGFEERGTRIGPLPALTTKSTSYAFESSQTGASGAAEPVAWSPCRPIHFVVNPAGAPEDFVEKVVASVGAASAATGLVFVNDGVTDEPPTSNRASYLPARYGDRWAPVLIQFGDDVTIDRFKTRAVGVGLTHSTNEIHTGRRYLVSGRVALDIKLLRSPKVAGAPAYIPVLRHEIGHVLGLDHVDDDDQLMNPTSGEPVTYQAGDLTGLARLGRGECAPWL